MAEMPKRDTTGNCEGECKDQVGEMEKDRLRAFQPGLCENKMMLRKMQKVLFIALLLFPLAGGWVACDKEGPAEKAGEKIDEAVDEAGDKMEQAGEKVDDAVEEAGDKMEKATD